MSDALKTLVKVVDKTGGLTRNRYGDSMTMLASGLTDADRCDLASAYLDAKAELATVTTSGGGRYAAPVSEALTSKYPKGMEVQLRRGVTLENGRDAGAYAYGKVERSAKDGVLVKFPNGYLFTETGSELY